MKVGIIGAGAVGSACLLAMVMRGSAREVVLVNRDQFDGWTTLGTLESVSSVQISTSYPRIDCVIVKLADRLGRPLY